MDGDFGERPSPADRRRLLSSVLRADEFQPLSALVTVEFGAQSRVGAHHVANEDHYLILRLSRQQEVVATTLAAADLPGRFEEYGYAMVLADGAGAQGSGAIASRIAISALAHLAIRCGSWNLRIDAQTAESVMNRAEWFYKRAASAVYDHRLPDGALTGMCTTLTLTFSAGDELFYAHVGHSRAYLFRDGELTQLTRDHTLEPPLTEGSAPVALSPDTDDLRHILTDAIGAGSVPPIVDVERLRLCDNDLVLLCSDGLSSALDGETIADVLAQPRTLKDLCQQLIDLAEGHNADDDATAVLARYRIPAE